MLDVVHEVKKKFSHWKIKKSTANLFMSLNFLKIACEKISLHRAWRLLIALIQIMVEIFEDGFLNLRQRVILILFST